mgnify:CR=1 FL=1
MIAERRHFTTDQWEALLLRSAGYEPTALSEKERLHFIARMVPLAERNYNLCELGPRGTGKSHIYKEVSPYAILLSGGQTTTANLFGRMNAKGEGRLGLVGLWDCVTFDEVAGNELQGRQRRADHERLHGLGQLRPRARHAECRCVHRAGGQHQRLGAERAEDHAPVRPLPARVQRRQRHFSTASTAIFPDGRFPRCGRIC